MMTNRLIIIAVLGSLCLISCGCSRDGAVKETILLPGQSVEATNKFGTVKVSYVSPSQRKYEWDGESRIIRMIPRDERFDRKLGLYDPADSWLFFSSKTRLVVEEAVCDFDNEEEMKADLITGSAVMDWVYTNDGLVIGFGKSPGRRQINVDVFQFLIRGQKPSGLAGARPANIRLLETKPSAGNRGR